MISWSTGDIGTKLALKVMTDGFMAGPETFYYERKYDIGPVWPLALFQETAIIITMYCIYKNNSEKV